MLVTREGMERAMRVQEVIVRGLSGALTWLQVAAILGRSPRSIRRMRWRFEQYGYDGLYDGRRAKPSPKRAPVAEVERICGCTASGTPASMGATSIRWPDGSTPSRCP